MHWKYWFAGIMGATLPVMALDPAAAHMIEALPQRDVGRMLYIHHCQPCHGKDKRGVAKAPVTAEVIARKPFHVWLDRLEKGCYGDHNKSRRFLDAYQRVKVLRFLERQE